MKDKVTREEIPLIPKDKKFTGLKLVFETKGTVMGLSLKRDVPVSDEEIKDKIDKANTANDLLKDVDSNKKK